MTGPCLCGDTACPSCGPAQGYDPAWERLEEEMCEKFGFMHDLFEDHYEERAQAMEWLIDKGRDHAFEHIVEMLGEIEVDHYHDSRQLGTGFTDFRSRMIKLLEFRRKLNAQEEEKKDPKSRTEA